MLTETLRKMCQDVREQRSKMILKNIFISMSILDFNLIGEEVSRSCGDVTILRHQSFFPVKTGERRELFDVRDDTFWR